jgi:hypothetical protein
MAAPLHDRDELDGHLGGLESVWEGGLRAAYAFYRLRAGPQRALAAALVESAMSLQDIGGQAPAPAKLLLADLCLARASRLLADTRDERLQVGFAAAVQRVAAAAAGGPGAEPLRDQLLAAMEAAR